VLAGINMNKQLGLKRNLIELKGNVRHREDKCTWYKKQLQKSAADYFNLK